MERPVADQPHYGAHLGDAEYWRPYVAAALQTAALPVAELEAPFVGSFPTFLVGDVVVKLFGPNFDGVASCGAERAMHELLAAHPEIPAPLLITAGALFDDGDAWPFLITERLRGEAVRERPATEQVAHDVGEAVAALHALPAPSAVATREIGGDAIARLAGFGLPEPLLDHVPAYLAATSPADTLVHADVTADHVFVRDGTLEAIIDWGDAIVADRYYELVAVYFDALGGRRDLFDVFLDGYGWRRDDDFAWRALQAVLMFQFNAIGRIGELVDLDAIRSLDELADRLFA